MMRTSVAKLVLGTAMLVTCTVNEAAAQTTVRTIKIIYPFAAGNSGDGLARILADRLGARLATSAIVENRAGASGFKPSD